MHGEGRPGLTTRMGTWLQSWDMYASPITLTFNKKPKFTTVPGGICSFITAFLIISYFCLQIYQMISSTGVTINQRILFNSDPQVATDVRPVGAGLTADQTQFSIRTENTTIAFKLGSTSEPLVPIIDRYVRAEYVKKTLVQNEELVIIDRKLEPVGSKQCSDMPGLRISLSTMTCPDAEEFVIEGQSTSPVQITFALRVDSCRALAQDPDTECESEAEIQQQLKHLYVSTVVVTQTANPYGANDDSNLIMYKTENERNFFIEGLRVAYHIQLQKSTIDRSFDHIFGTNLMRKVSYLIYKQLDRQIFLTRYTAEYQFNALFLLELMQSETTIKMTIVPQNLVGVLSILGGFLAMITRITGFLLRNYQRFTFRKSSIKKLYYYSRTKKKNERNSSDHGNEVTAMASNISNETFEISQASDFDENNLTSVAPTTPLARLNKPKGAASLSNSEVLNQAQRQAERDAKRREKRLGELLHIMKSKTILSFGYKSFLNYYYKMSCFNTMRFFGRFSCCKCFRVTKHSSMTARKFKRQANAQMKMNQELDVIEIVKTLRQARFLIDNTMTEHQKKLIDYFKIYSLETPSIKKEQAFSKLELFRTFLDASLDAHQQKINDDIIDKILIGRKGNVEYLDATNKSESSSHESTVEIPPAELVDPAMLDFHGLPESGDLKSLSGMEEAASLTRLRHLQRTVSQSLGRDLSNTLASGTKMQHSSSIPAHQLAGVAKSKRLSAQHKFSFNEGEEAGGEKPLQDSGTSTVNNLHFHVSEDPPEFEGDEIKLAAASLEDNQHTEGAQASKDAEK